MFIKTGHRVITVIRDQIVVGKTPARATIYTKMYYDGVLRQRGAGLGDVFRVLARTIVPNVLRIGKNFVKQKAATLGPKAINAGVGVVRDLMTKKNI